MAKSFKAMTKWSFTAMVEKMLKRYFDPKNSTMIVHLCQMSVRRHYLFMRGEAACSECGQMIGTHR